MRDATHAAIQYALNEHERADWTTQPDRLCWALGIRVIAGKRSSAHAGPPAIITLAREHYAPRQRFTMHHEIAHVLIQRAGLEDAILAEVDDEDAHRHLEAVTNYVASLLVMPDVMISHALDTYGQHPETILTIQQIARVSLGAALRRFTYAQRGGVTTLLTSGAYIADLASTDPYNRLHRHQRLPDISAALPGAQLLSLPSARRRTLAVLAV